MAFGFLSCSLVHLHHVSSAYAEDNDSCDHAPGHSWNDAFTGTRLSECSSPETLKPFFQPARGSECRCEV